MYSLDVNFIKDRPEYQSKTKTRSKPGVVVGTWTPLYLGLATGILLPAIVGLGWLFLQSQNSRLEQEIAQVDAELSRLGIQEQEIQKIQAQTTQLKAETQALATVFNQIRPWSAMLQDIRDRIPTTVQIESLKQTATAAVATPQPTPAATPTPGGNAPPPTPTAPTPAGGIEIVGIARSFNDVNDFLLTLQRSSFFKAADTRIITAELTEGAATSSGGQNAPVIRGPQAVRYTMQTSLSDVSASELLRELERKGTLGLVTRIRTLQQKGVIQ